MKEKKTKEISKKLFIEELEYPAQAKATATTLAIGEECGCCWMLSLIFDELAGKADSV